MHTIAEVGDGRRRRRLHSDAFKAKLVVACQRPGVSIASVALAHGLNANLLRRWIRDREPDVAKPRMPALAISDAAPSFVPLTLSKAPASTGDIRIELCRDDLRVAVTWPVSSAPECAAWLRELMR